MVGVNPHERVIRPAEVAAASPWLCGPGSECVNGHAIDLGRPGLKLDAPRSCGKNARMIKAVAHRQPAHPMHQAARA